MTAEVELLPCPFCGAGKTEIRENGRPWLGMRYGEPVSVSVRHWCDPIEGQPSRMIERVGRDRAAAIDAWNTRATDANLAALQAEIEALRAEVREAREFRDKMANAIGNDQLRRFIEKHGEPVPLTIRMQEAEARAERLAEALRELVEVFSESGMYDEEVFVNARKALEQENRND